MGSFFNSLDTTWSELDTLYNNFTTSEDIKTFVMDVSWLAFTKLLCAYYLDEDYLYNIFSQMFDEEFPIYYDITVPNDISHIFEIGTILSVHIPHMLGRIPYLLRDIVDFDIFFLHSMFTPKDHTLAIEISPNNEYFVYICVDKFIKDKLTKFYNSKIDRNSKRISFISAATQSRILDPDVIREITLKI